MKYQNYIKTQKAGYEKKKDRIWTNQQNIRHIAERILLPNNLKTGICHGVRTGYEVWWFREYLHSDVIGTELGAADPPHVYEWDFNKQNPEWIGKFDFVYSNSHDHAFDIHETLKTWKEQIRPGGALILEHSPGHEASTELDPIGLQVEELMLKNIVIEHRGNRVDVGSGFSHEQRRFYFENPDKIVGKQVTIQYFEESQNQNGTYSLRFPVIKAVYDTPRNF